MDQDDPAMQAFQQYLDTQPAVDIQESSSSPGPALSASPSSPSSKRGSPVEKALSSAKLCRTTSKKSFPVRAQGGVQIGGTTRKTGVPRKKKVVAEIVDEDDTDTPAESVQRSADLFFGKKASKLKSSNRRAQVLSAVAQGTSNEDDDSKRAPLALGESLNVALGKLMDRISSAPDDPDEPAIAVKTPNEMKTLLSTFLEERRLKPGMPGDTATNEQSFADAVMGIHELYVVGSLLNYWNLVYPFELQLDMQSGGTASEWFSKRRADTVDALARYRHILGRYGDPQYNSGPNVDSYFNGLRPNLVALLDPYVRHVKRGSKVVEEEESSPKKTGGTAKKKEEMSPTVETVDDAKIKSLVQQVFACSGVDTSAENYPVWQPRVGTRKSTARKAGTKTLAGVVKKSQDCDDVNDLMVVVGKHYFAVPASVLGTSAKCDSCYLGTLLIAARADEIADSTVEPQVYVSAVELVAFAGQTSTKANVHSKFSFYAGRIRAHNLLNYVNDDTSFEDLMQDPELYSLVKFVNPVLLLPLDDALAYLSTPAIGTEDYRDFLKQQIQQLVDDFMRLRAASFVGRQSSPSSFEDLLRSGGGTRKSKARQVDDVLAKTSSRTHARAGKVVRKKR